MAPGSLPTVVPTSLPTVAPAQRTAPLGAAPHTTETYYCFMFTAVCIIWSAVVIVLALA